MNVIHKLAFVLFGKFVRKNREGYSSVRTAIKQAHFTLPWDIYVSTAYLWAFVSAVLGTLLAFMLTPLWKTLYMYYLKVAERIAPLGFGSYGETIFIIVLCLFISLFIGAAVYYGILAYPGLVARTRKSKIDLTLPHAVAYMHALSKGGLSLISIFRSLHENVNVYGEAAEEIGYIVLDTELHGSDIITALKNAAVWTQSDKFRDFLENLVNVASTGGDLEIFFENMVEHYQNSAEADQNMYLELLGMFAETYITVFVAGPLFLITIIIVVGMMSPGALLMIKLLIYAVIPLSAIAFSILLSLIALGSDIKFMKVFTVSKKLRHYDDVRTVSSHGDERRVRRLFRSLRWTSVIEIRKSPLKPFFSDPFRTFYISAPLSIIYFTFSIHQRSITVDLIDDSLIISVLILLVPFLFFYETLMRRIRAIENSVPDFLKRLAVINEVGMPLDEAIRSISRINFGVLSSEVKLMYKDMTWSNSVLSALTKFEHRVRTVSVSRIVTLILKASESTGNIKETLRVAANDAALAEKLRRRKFTVLFSYLVVVYISFAVFLLVLYIFATMFLPKIPEISGTGSGMFAISAQKEDYNRLFMHATVIQGFFSGIIAGQITGESPYDGLKHSMIMVTTAYIFFTWFV